MKAVIARSDLVTAYGWGIDPLWNGLMAGQTAVTSTARFSREQPAPQPLARVPDLSVAPGGSRARTMLDRLLSPLFGMLDPLTPIILATTVGEIECIERAVFENNAEFATDSNPQVLLAHIKKMLALAGPAMVLSSACASSSAALTRAASMIERDSIPAVLVITCDVVSEFVYSGFSTLLSLCDTPARPFDAGRCGLSLGEAAAWALITRSDSPWARKDSPVILGWSNTADAVHMTAPDRLGAGLSRAIAGACRMASIQPQQIACIAAHGTATIYNDAMELTAFGNSIPNPVPTFSVKGGTGHTLAAAGLLQILIAARAMKLRTLPPTVGLVVPDERAIGWAHNTPVDLPENPIALSTNSGFGGVNTAVLLGCATEIFQPRASIAGASICAVSWFSSRDCGSIAPHGKTEYSRASPQISDSKEMTALIGRPLKYFPRMTAEARVLLAAVRLTMKAAGWNDSVRIGILSCGYDGWLSANQEYFRDYVAQGRSLGRANLFIYTLPTSAMSEVGIALTLTGPTLHLHADIQPRQSLLKQAMSMVQNDDADGMLCVWSDGTSAVCVAVGRGKTMPEYAIDSEWDLPVDEICQTLSLSAAGL
jgi:3-oxoacyl-[acyl-carrier-protein] synthase II